MVDKDKIETFEKQEKELKELKLKVKHLEEKTNVQEEVKKLTVETEMKINSYELSIENLK